MPKGRPRLDASERRDTPAACRHEESFHSSAAAPSSPPAVVAEAGNVALPTDHDTSPALEYCRCDVRNAVDWSANSLRQRIEERGMILPVSLTKEQLLTIYANNFCKTSRQAVPAASTSVVRTRPPPSAPSSRLNVAADANRVAARAGQSELNTDAGRPTYTNRKSGRVITQSYKM